VSGGAGAIALACGCVGRPPSLRSKGRAWGNTKSLGWPFARFARRDFQSVLDGIAAAVQRALQADAVVSVAGYFLLPSVRFVDDYFQFFYCQVGCETRALASRSTSGGSCRP